MPYDLEFPNGDIYEVDDNIEPADAVKQIRQMVMQEYGVKSDEQMQTEAKERYDADMAQRTEDMGSIDRLRAGAGRGLVNTMRQLKNIGGAMSDEELNRLTERDQALMDTAEGKIGNIVGEIAATAPVGAGAAGAVMKGVTATGRAGRALPAALAAGEGAAIGALYGGPGARQEGAMIGALGGAAANRLAAGARRLTKGAVRKSDAAKETQEMMRFAGEDDFIPLSEAAAEGGGSGALAFTYRNMLPMFPLTGGALKKQKDSMMGSFRRTAINQAYGKQGAKAVKESLEQQGDMVKALRAGDKTVKNNRNAKAREELMEAAKASDELGAFTPSTLVKKNEGEVLRRLAHNMKTITRGQPGESTISARDAFYNARRLNTVAIPMVDLMFTGGALSGVGGLTRAMATKRVQRALMGDTRMQKWLLQKLDSNQPLLKELGRAVRYGLTAETVE